MVGELGAVGEAGVPYQALYRRFRPQHFAEVLGQDHVTRALRAAVRDAKVAHAYLFSGPRGTGKTSTARILAMALNCERPEDGEPCGTCPSCVAVRTGASLDVQELDAATNRGIDEMRDLLSRVALGTPGRWKVYIVDEVHQITPAAASALLKTLEEPPGHVIFVLATTDPQKVLDTIRSRTQHYEFRLLGPDVLSKLLSEVSERASLDLPPDAIDVVVRRGKGSARDALSALDQVAAAGAVEDDTRLVGDLVDALVERDPGGVLVWVASATEAGMDPRRLGSEVLAQLRNGFLATRARSLVLLADADAERVEGQARRLGAAGVVRAMELVGQSLIDMRDCADPRITLEVALVRAAAPELDATPAALLERIERLERSQMTVAAPSRPVLGGPPALPAQAGPPPTPAGPPAPPPPAPTPAAAPSPPTSTPAAAPSPPAPTPPPAAGPPSGAPAAPAPGGLPTREELTLAWGDRILASLRPAVKVYVANGRFLPPRDGRAVYAVRDRGLLGRAHPNLAEIEAALASHFGRPVPLALVLDDGPPEPSGVPDEEVAPADWAEMPEAAVVSPEQRLLEAFPGAEEVEL